MPRRVATGVDPKRLAMIVAVLSRHAGIALGAADVFVNVAGGVRIDEPGADLAVAIAIASAARGVPVRDSVAVFGEIGLTGRLRSAAQAERRLEECTKLGVATVIAPDGTTGRGGPRIICAETLRQAIAAGLEPAVDPSGGRRGGVGETMQSSLVRSAEGGRAGAGGSSQQTCRLVRRRRPFTVMRTRSWLVVGEPGAAARSRTVARGAVSELNGSQSEISARMMFPRRQPLSAGGFREMADNGRPGLFDVGDNVVYPHHGAGTVVSKESRIVLGQEREYLTIKILHNDMTVNVPTENAEKVGLRWVIGLDAVEVVVKALSGESTEMPKNWNRRFKHNRDKMKTGDILELAEVVRNLALRDHEKGLSTGEKQMYVKAKKILASEFMYAKNMSEDDAAEWLDEVLANPAGGKRKVKPKAKVAAASA